MPRKSNFIGFVSHINGECDFELRTVWAERVSRGPKRWFEVRFTDLETLARSARYPDEKNLREHFRISRQDARDVLPEMEKIREDILGKRTDRFLNYPIVVQCQYGDKVYIRRIQGDRQPLKQSALTAKAA